MKALEVAALGFPVFPVRLCPTACLKCKLCKAPACPHGFHDASSDPEQIKRLWRDYPGELIGVATGAASGFDVLDIDSTKHPEATAWWMSHRRYIPAPARI
jgi:Bifunctional DNA primase/polymerase, N-terminal